MSPLEKGRRRENHLEGTKKLQRGETDHPLSRRDPPVDQEPAGCPPSMGRKMNRHSHRGNDRESEFHGNQRPSFKMSYLYPRTDKARGSGGISTKKCCEDSGEISENRFWTPP